MSTRRKIITTLGAGAFALPISALAQQTGKVWRIGYIDFGSRQSMVDLGRYAALMDGLRELGYVEGKNFIFEPRFMNGKVEQFSGATELVNQKVDLILTTGSQASHAARQATPNIPIIVTAISDPVREGYAQSLARPGGNVTGMTTGIDDVVQKLVEMLQVTVPKVKKIAVITNSQNSAHATLLKQVQTAARKTGKQIFPVNVHTPQDIENGFSTLVNERSEAVIIFADAVLLQQRSQIAALAIKNRLPSINALPGYAEAGGLMSYGVDTNDNFRRAAIFVDKILKGAKPSTLPFEEPTRFYFVINRKVANVLGIKFTNELLARADKVIE
jgi:putative ABC transport system substrate-binding protein